MLSLLLLLLFLLVVVIFILAVLFADDVLKLAVVCVSDKDLFLVKIVEGFELMSIPVSISISCRFCFVSVCLVPSSFCLVYWD